MAIRTDIKLVNGDLDIENNDFVIYPSDQQHIEDTVNAFPGWWKENPSDGVGVLAYTKSSGSNQQLARSIQLQLQSDGYSVKNPEISFDSSGKLVINPNAIIQ